MVSSEAITKMTEAANQVVNSSQAQEWQGELQDTIFRLVNDDNGESRLQLQDELPEVVVIHHYLLGLVLHYLRVQNNEHQHNKLDLIPSKLE